MRKAAANFDFIVDNDQFIGVSLGYDHCAEHEWGIDKMKDQFGIGKEKTGLLSMFSKKEFGLPARMITEGEVCLVENKEFTFLYSDEWQSWNRKDLTFKQLLPRDIDLDTFYRKDLQTAWNEENFGILTRNEQGRTYLKELKEAFDKKDIAIARFGGGPFENPSLTIAIASRIPADTLKELYDVDKKAYELKEYEKKIGVAALKNKKEGGLKEKEFFAVSPRWIEGTPEEVLERKAKLNTKHDIWFWVNNSDNDRNSGWYSAEEVIKWLSTPKLKLSEIRKG